MFAGLVRKLNIYFNSHLNSSDHSSYLDLGRTIVFARTSGVSLDGHVMLSTEDVQHNWLDVSLMWHPFNNFAIC